MAGTTDPKDETGRETAAIVEAFIADYARWNAAAEERSTRAGRSRSDEQMLGAMELAKQEYAEILGRYCRPSFEGRPISYGTPSLHDPETERVVSARPRGDRCLVATQSTQKIGKIERSQDFEYRLSRADGRWFLESVKCMTDGGRYESL